MQVDKVGQFTAQIVDALRNKLFQLQDEAKAAVMQEEKDQLEQV